MTNYEKLKAMTPEEIVDFLEKFEDNPCNFCSKNFRKCPYPEEPCGDGYFEWLNQEVAE